MAIIKQGILGGIQNKIGNIVGSSWKGIAILKSLPVSVANPRTAPQVEQRTRFANVVAFATAILAEVIKPLWDRFAQRQSGYNAFVSRNIENFDASGLVTPANLVISSGKMSATQIVGLALDGGANEIAFTWANDAGQGFKQATDTLFVVARNRNTGVVAGYDTGIQRSSLSASIILNMSNGNVIDVWAAFRRVDGTIVSDTSYATGTAV
jgi:hypothetical protein